MSRRRWLALAIAGVAFLLLAGRVIAALWVDRAWYVSLGADPLWRAMAGHTLAVRIGAWALATAFVYANIYGVRRSVVSVVLPRRVGDLEIGEEVPPPMLTAAAFAVAVVLGGVLALGGPSWLDLASARYGLPFGETDPAFGYDLGFFVYWLPLEQVTYEWALICTVVVIAVVVVLYALTPSLRWEEGRLRVTGYVRKHLTILGAVVLALLAWSHRLDAFELLIRGSGADGAFTYADRHVNVSTDLLLALLTFSAAIAVIVTGWVGQVRLAFGIVTVVLVTSLVLRQVLPAVADRLATTETPAAREGPYRATRAAYTRRAFAVDRITRATAPSLAHVGDIARAVPAWEPQLLRLALERAGAGMLVGDFAWRSRRGEVRAITINAPAGGTDASPGEPWRLVDVSVAPANVGGELPPQPPSTERAEVLLAPVFFHPGALTPLVIDDDDGAVIGAPFTSFLSRLAHAWSQQNFRLLSTPDGVSGKSQRMLVRRDVRERVQRLAPSLLLGRAVVPISVGDTVWWAVDLYAWSNHYPLSEHLEVAGTSVSYLRHAAVALVHAHTGATMLVADADARLDPMARAWIKRFPNIFMTSDRLPAAIAAQLQAPIDAVEAQAIEFARVGSRSEPVAGRRVPESGADSLVGREGEPPFAGSEEGQPLFHTIPVVDGDDRVRGVIATAATLTRDPVWVPLDDGDVRWTPAVARLRRWSDSASARGDARTVRGAVRVIPVAGRAVLVQPSYRWRSDAPPTLAAVAVFDRGSVVPLEALAPGADSAIIPGAPGGDARFREHVTRLYERMREAMRRGDWPAFGAAYDSLGGVVRQRRRVP